MILDVLLPLIAPNEVSLKRQKWLRKTIYIFYQRNENSKKFSLDISFDTFSWKSPAEKITKSATIL